MLQEGLKKWVVSACLDEDSNHCRLMPLVVMHEVQFHRAVLMINRVLTWDMKMELFKQVEVVIKYDSAVLIEIQHRLTVPGVTRLGC